MADIKAISASVDALRARNAKRDRNWAEITLIRHGEFDRVAPGLFNEQIKQPVVANEIDIAARQFAGVLSVLPTISCSSASQANVAATGRASKRTTIANHYVFESKIEQQLITAADQYNTYGVMISRVEADFTDKSVKIQFINPTGCYYVNNSWGETVKFARIYQKHIDELEADYPVVAEHRWKLPQLRTDDFMVDVVEYEDKNTCCVFIAGIDDFYLEHYANELGRCSYTATQRPGLDDVTQGSYDHVIWLQLARHKLNLMLLQGVEKAINAPVGVPEDVNAIQVGSDAFLRSREPGQIRRVDLSLPNQVFAFPAMLADAQRNGSMQPEALTGNSDASIITGQGVKALQAGWNDQIALGQRSIAQHLRTQIGIAFERDEKLFASRERKIEGIANGVPYDLTYIPVRDIKGNYSVEVTYGYAAGLDPNRAFILLQGMYSLGVLSKETLAKQMPVGINPEAEITQVGVEQSRAALIAAMSGYAQSIPQLAAMGGDPVTALTQMATFIDLQLKGRTVEEAALTAFTPPKAPPPAPPGPGELPPGEGAAPGAPGEAAPSGSQPPGTPAGGLAQIFAGITESGGANLSGTTARMFPTAQ